MISLFDYFSVTTLHRHEIIPVKSMIGRKSATIAGVKVFVSPAMLHLIRSAESRDESVHILRNIPAYIIGSKNYVQQLQEAVHGTKE